MLFELILLALIDAICERFHEETCVLSVSYSSDSLNSLNFAFCWHFKCLPSDHSLEQCLGQTVRTKLLRRAIALNFIVNVFSLLSRFTTESYSCLTLESCDSQFASCAG